MYCTKNSGERTGGGRDTRAHRARQRARMERQRAPMGAREGRDGGNDVAPVMPAVDGARTDSAPGAGGLSSAKEFAGCWVNCRVVGQLVNLANLLGDLTRVC